MNIISKISLAVAAGACALSLQARSDSANLQSRMENWFSASLEGKSGQAFSPDIKLRISEIPEMEKLVWNAWLKANKNFDEEKLPTPKPIADGDSGVWNIPAALEADAAMKYYWGSKGDKPSQGYPLFLYLHGSGAPDREWSNGLHFARTFADSPSVYFVPKIPRTGEWYRWWQKGKQYAWEKLLRQALASGQIDPDRIYFFGISEGGYGSQRLASFYADYLAAAGPMAGGEPLMNAPAENCRNIAFSLRTGDRDFGFYRDKLTRYTLEAFDSLQALHPAGYIHNIELIPGKGHSIDYRPTTPWLSAFRRNPYPKKVSWEDFEMDGIHRTGFYNIRVTERPLADKRTRYNMDITGNNIDMTVENIEYSTVETDSKWGIALKFDRTYSPAVSGKFTIFLNSKLVDLDKPVTVTVNGKKAFYGKVKCSLDNMLESCAEYHDPRRVFPASVSIDIAKLQK
ncbi:MAG: hypothetical protein HFJ94_02680 [Muribaculaceae bacterium]|nr:hypothetical protein [Muribaculaceae bacterium]